MRRRTTKSPTARAMSTTASGGRGASAHPPSGTAVSVKRATGHVDDLSGDEAGLLGDEEGDGGRDVVGLADPRHRYLLGGVRDEVLERHADPLGGGPGHVGLDEAGGDGVRGDPELAELDGEGLGEALQAGLRGGVVELPAVAQRRGAREVD